MDIFQGPTQRSSWEEGGGGGKHPQGCLNCVFYNSFPISNFPSHWYPDLFFFSSFPFVLPFFSFLPLSSIFFKSLSQCFEIVPSEFYTLYVLVLYYAKDYNSSVLLIWIRSLWGTHRSRRRFFPSPTKKFSVVDLHYFDLDPDPRIRIAEKRNRIRPKIEENSNLFFFNQ